jgi:hypothetical protein
MDGGAAIADSEGTRGAMILRAIDAQFPEVAWGASLSDVQGLYPGGRLAEEIVDDPAHGEDVRFYRAVRPLVGYPYPVVLTFLFDPGLRGLTVEFPREVDPETGAASPPGRMVSQSLLAHVKAALHLAFGDPDREDTNADRRTGDEPVIARSTWRHGATEVTLEARSRLGSGWISVRMVDSSRPGEPLAVPG